MKLLVVVDVQNDFVDGALGSGEAQSVVPHILDKLGSWRGPVIFTQDTHGPNYLETLEGARLPVAHCIEGTAGWELVAGLRQASEETSNAPVIKKGGFGTFELVGAVREIIEDLAHKGEHLEAIELVGFCTDICVIANALIVKTAFPEIPVEVDVSCCAGTSPAAHEAALTVMKSCQIDLI